MTYLLDTTILVGLLRANHIIVSKYNKLSKKGIDKGITTYTIAELYEGFYRNKEQEIIKAQQKIFEILLNEFEREKMIFSLTRNKAINFPKFKIALEKKGTPMPIIDLLIGTIAIVNNFILITTDVAHYQLLKSAIAEFNVEFW